MAIDDRVRAHASPILVEAGVTGVIAVTDTDAIGGSDLTAVNIEFALHVDLETANIVRAPVLDKCSGTESESPHGLGRVNAQCPIGQIIGAIAKPANVQVAVDSHQ